MDGIWWLIIGVFIGGISTFVLMSMLQAGSEADNILLGERQYEEN